MGFSSRFPEKCHFLDTFLTVSCPRNGHSLRFYRCFTWGFDAMLESDIIVGFRNPRQKPASQQVFSVNYVTFPTLFGVAASERDPKSGH